MEILQKISAFFNQFRWAITLALLACCIMQQCTISTLRSQLAFVKDKYENPINNINNEATESVSNTDTDYPTTLETDNNTIITIVYFLIALGIILSFAWYKSWWPFSVWLKGKIWQDLNGRVVYTLTATNRGREAVTLNNATIEFINLREQRKFRMPVTDFPLTLTKGTTHTFSVSLQKLMEQHQELTNYKMIRVSVECNGTIRRTLPLGIRWQKA